MNIYLDKFRNKKRLQSYTSNFKVLRDELLKEKDDQDDEEDPDEEEDNIVCPPVANTTGPWTYGT